ncbi:MAG: class I SAM-dependent methyltransferase [Deltaproteobacteria bacterium]|nr:class I SAM-dependent methyltransferase [Deltaproteobacteria bacterium]
MVPLLYGKGEELLNFSVRPVSPEYSPAPSPSGWKNALRTLYLNTLGSPALSTELSAHADSSNETYGGSYLYDTLYFWEPEWLKHLIDYCAPSKTPVLILGGGTGQEAFAIARSGLDCVMIDQSPAMLEGAIKRFQTLSSPERARIRLFNRDIRTLEWLGRFDRIICVGGPATFLGGEEEIARFFRWVHASLLDSGEFLFDIFNIHYWKTRSHLGKGRWQHWFTGRQGTHVWIRSFEGSVPHTFDFQKAVSLAGGKPHRCRRDRVALLPIPLWISLCERSGLKCRGISPSLRREFTAHQLGNHFKSTNMPLFLCEKGVPE